MDYRSLANCLPDTRSAATAVAGLSLDIDAGIARLTLERGDGNALRADDLRALVALVEQAEISSARVLILRSGLANRFCVGVDLNELAMLHRTTIARVPFRNVMRGAINALRMTPMPVIAEVAGDCFGLGLALAAACDIRVAGPKARFAVDAARLGVGLPIEDIVRLRALIGEGQAARLMFSAAPIDAKEAARIGLVEFATLDVTETVDAMAATIAANAPGSVASLKHGLEIAAAGHLGDEGHNRAFDAAFGGEECAEGVAAARSNRTPNFNA